MPAEPSEPNYFATTELAEANRLEKAKTIARHLYSQSISADTAAHLPAEERKAVVKACDLVAASDLTWQVVTDLLRKRAEYDALHPPTAEPAVKGTPVRKCVVVACGKPGLVVRASLPGSRCAEHDAPIAARVPVPDPELTADAFRRRAEARRAAEAQARQAAQGEQPRVA